MQIKPTNCIHFVLISKNIIKNSFSASNTFLWLTGFLIHTQKVSNQRIYIKLQIFIAHEYFLFVSLMTAIPYLVQFSTLYQCWI